MLASIYIEHRPVRVERQSSDRFQWIVVEVGGDRLVFHGEPDELDRLQRRFASLT